MRPRSRRRPGSAADRAAAARRLGVVGARRGDVRRRPHLPAVDRPRRCRSPETSVEEIFAGARGAGAAASSPLRAWRCDDVSLVRSVADAIRHADPRRRGPRGSRRHRRRPGRPLDTDFERIHDELFGKGSGFRAGGVDFTAFQVRATANTGQAEVLAEAAEQADSSRRAPSTGTSSASAAGHADVRLRAHRRRPRARR